MNQLPNQPLTQEQQQRFLQQMFRLMGKQVQSYHKHHHMGESSSVPTELAQELMESVEYTVNLAGGITSRRNLEISFHLGQRILEAKCADANRLLDLVYATAPQWQTSCRWDALEYLRHYLCGYDHLHLAHKGPEGLFYPIPVSPPGDLQGIDVCLFYLRVLWIENQIMAAIPEPALEDLWNRLPASALNQCEYLLVNAMGKSLLGSCLTSLTFEPEERLQLMIAMERASEDTLLCAANQLCQRLRLKDDNTGAYLRSILPQFSLWTGHNIHNCNLEEIFL